MLSSNPQTPSALRASSLAIVVATSCLVQPCAAQQGPVDDRVRQIYDQGLPPVGQPSPVIGEQKETEGLEVRDLRGRDVAAAARFTRHDGVELALGDLLEGPPVLLCLNYSRCPALCGLQQKYLAEGLRDLKLTPGEDYRLVSVSIDPLEQPETAAATRKHFVEGMGQLRSVEGVDFLVGTKEEIDAVAESVGFEYRFVRKTGEYAHAASMMVITPSGTISRYLGGFYGQPDGFDGRTLRLSLVEASEGKVSSVVDSVLLYCFKYDSVRGKYSPVAWRIMQVGAATTVVILLAALLPVWIRAARGEETIADDDATADPDADRDPETV